MEKGISFETKYIEKYLGEIEKIEIETIVNEIDNYEYVIPKFEEEISTFNKQATEEELMSIRRYTGYNFRRINAILRNNWNYEEHGKKDEDTVNELKEDISIIDRMFNIFPKTRKPFITYRGTSIESFRKYNIINIEDLESLKGKCLYESGYTSTSINEEESYFGKKINDKQMNIEIKYIIIPNSQDGIPLITNDLSYSKSQQEYLINRSSLSKVIDVEIINNTAIITAVLIPRSIWNKQDYQDNKKRL